MAVIITPQSEIDEYFATDAMSQSLLKALLSGPDKFLDYRDADKEEKKKLHYEEKDSWIKGSGIDILLTGEEGEFEKQFYVSQIEKKPSDVEMSITHYILDSLIDGLQFFDGEEKPTVESLYSLEMYEELVLESVNHHNWQPNYKTETKIKKIVDTCALYFEDLKKAHGKQVIDVTQNNAIREAVMSLRTHSRTAHYFDRETLGRSLDVDCYLQVPIYFTYNGVDCKALLDMVFVFRNEQGRVTHIIPLDVKSMAGKTSKFITSVHSWRYDVQAAWYTLALLDWHRQFDFVEEYVLQNFHFIVESSTHAGNPLVYKVTNELLSIGKYGRESLRLFQTDLFEVPVEQSLDNSVHDIIMARKIKGYDELLNEYKWYEENGWEEEKVITQSLTNGVLEIGWNGIIEKDATEIRTNISE